jgi:hypothetical protein
MAWRLDRAGPGHRRPQGELDGLPLSVTGVRIRRTWIDPRVGHPDQRGVLAVGVKAAPWPGTISEAIPSTRRRPACSAAGSCAYGSSGGPSADHHRWVNATTPSAVLAKMVEPGRREQGRVERVVGVMVREDHVGDIVRVDAELPQWVEDGGAVRNHSRIDDQRRVAVTDERDRARRVLADVALEQHMHLGRPSHGTFVSCHSYLRHLPIAAAAGPAAADRTREIPVLKRRCSDLSRRGIWEGTVALAVRQPERRDSRMATAHRSRPSIPPQSAFARSGSRRR